MAGLEPVKRVAEFTYDFSLHGGAIGDIALDKLVPAGALVTSGMIKIITQVVDGGTGAIAIALESSEDILAAADISGSAAGAMLDVVPVGSAATSILVSTAASGLTITIAGAAVTAGKFKVYLEYFLA